jgi:hypothetical protein
MYTIGGAQMTSTSAVIFPLFKLAHNLSMESFVPLHFQFPPTTNFPVPAHTTREDACRLFSLANACCALIFTKLLLACPPLMVILWEDASCEEDADVEVVFVKLIIIIIIFLS